MYRSHSFSSISPGRRAPYELQRFLFFDMGDVFACAYQGTEGASFASIWLHLIRIRDLRIRSVLTIYCMPPWASAWSPSSDVATITAFKWPRRIPRATKITIQHVTRKGVWSRFSRYGINYINTELQEWRFSFPPPRILQGKLVRNLTGAFYSGGSI